MPVPRLTFFAELPAEPLIALLERPGVVSFLAEHHCAVSMGLLDLESRRAEGVRRLEAAGVPVTGWLLLDPADGTWLNADNPDRARERWEQTHAWAEREGLELHRIGLDVEPPRRDVEALLRAPGRALLRLLRERRSAQQLAAAERAFSELVRAIRATERSVESYHFPLLLDERAAGSSLLRRTLGLVEVEVDLEVHMLYASYLGRGGVRAYLPDAPAVALGVTGGGVNADAPATRRRRLSWQALEEDLRAAATHTQEVYVFSLEGCVERDMLEPLAEIRWDDPPPPLAPAALRRARLARAALRGVLRSESLVDRLSRRRPGGVPDAPAGRPPPA